MFTSTFELRYDSGHTVIGTWEHTDVQMTDAEHQACLEAFCLSNQVELHLMDVRDGVGERIAFYPCSLSPASVFIPVEQREVRLVDELLLGDHVTDGFLRGVVDHVSSVNVWILWQGADIFSSTRYTRDMVCACGIRVLDPTSLRDSITPGL